jgi:hypothetical protein
MHLGRQLEVHLGHVEGWLVLGHEVERLQMGLHHLVLVESHLL